MFYTQVVNLSTGCTKPVSGLDNHRRCNLVICRFAASGSNSSHQTLGINVLTINLHQAKPFNNWQLTVTGKPKQAMQMYPDIGLMTASQKTCSRLTVTCQKFKYNFTHIKDCHVTSATCYTVYSKDSLFNSLKIAVIKHRVVLKSNHTHLNHVRLQNFL